MKDSIQNALAAIRKKVSEKEAQIERLQAEIVELRAREQTLDDACLIVAEETDAAQAYAMQKAMDTRHSLSLQEEILICLQSPFAKAEGSSASEVVALLKARKYPASDSRSFYSAVYITLKRLCDKNEIQSLEGVRGRLFRAKDATSPLFAHDMKELA